jgi:aspartyl aminopeptidase
MKELKIESIINVDDDFEYLKEHQLWEETIAEARQIFYDKNHDYCSSWRMEDASSIARELGQRVVRVLRGLELKEEGKELKSSEGIYSEFRDMINWCVFAMIILKGYGWSPKDLILGILSKKENEEENKKYIEDIPQETILNINKLSLDINSQVTDIYKKDTQQDSITISATNINEALAELSSKVSMSSNTILINRDNILSQLNEFVLNNFLYKKASTFTAEELSKNISLENYGYNENEFENQVNNFLNKAKKLEENDQILYINYKKL